MAPIKQIDLLSPFLGQLGGGFLQLKLTTFSMIRSTHFNGLLYSGQEPSIFIHFIVTTQCHQLWVINISLHMNYQTCIICRDVTLSMCPYLLSGEGCFQPGARSWKGGCPNFVQALSVLCPGLYGKSTGWILMKFCTLFTVMV